MAPPPSAAGIRVEDGAVRCSGSWTLARIDRAERALRAVACPDDAALVVDASAVREMDTAGAWLLERTARRLGGRGRPVTLRLRPAHEPLLALLTSAVVAAPARDRERARFLSTLGRRAWNFARDAPGVVAFCGEIVVTAARARNGPLKVRVRQTLQLERSIRCERSAFRPSRSSSSRGSPRSRWSFRSSRWRRMSSACQAPCWSPAPRR